MDLITLRIQIFALFTASIIVISVAILAGASVLSHSNQITSSRASAKSRVSSSQLTNTSTSSVLSSTQTETTVQSGILNSSSTNMQGSNVSQTIDTSYNSSATTGLLAVQMTDPPNVPANVSGVYIDYTGIQVGLPYNSSELWYNATSAGEIDLMNLINISVSLGGKQVPAGTFDQLRFNISAAIITYQSQNYTALLQNGNITASIANGGVTINSNASAGLVLDISPTVVLYQNDSSIQFTLDASAVGVPIPPLSWDPNLVQAGNTANLTSVTWWQNTTNLLQGNITILYGILANDSLQLFVQNTGNGNITINEISILQNVTQVLSGNSTTANATSTTTNETQNTNLESQLVTIGDFQVLSNGTLIPPSLQGFLNSNNTNVSVGLIVGPNETITLIYEGNVTQDTSGNSQFAIVVGQTYEIAVLGDYGTSVYLMTVNPVYPSSD